MSAESIARWNSIPLSNPNESSQSSNLKRARPDKDDDDDDDDISIVSRTPSPTPEDSMDIDTENYDQYVRGQPREVITVETKIKSSNKGFAMLAKLGWSEGQPLGLSGEGRVDPVPFQIKRDLTGLGKTNQDVRMIETTVSQRRGLDSERQQKETEDQRRAREDIVARRAALQSEISTTLAAFYCSLCSKQFQNVAQYDEHTNSYAHHHKVRMKDMAANAKGLKNTDAEERMAKERKREEKELRRAAKAAGVKMAKPVTSVVTPMVAGGGSQGEGEAKPTGFKKSGWATVSSTEGPSASQPATGKGGWASTGPSNAATASSSWASASPSTVALSEPAAPPANTNFSAPSFRTAGWTSLDTGSSHTFPPVRTPSPPPPPPPPPPQPLEHAPPPLPSGPFSNNLAPPPPISAPPPPAQSYSNQSRGGRWGITTAPSAYPHHQAASRIEFPSYPAFVRPGPPSQGSNANLPQGQPSPPRPLPATTGWQQWKSVGSKKR